MVRNGQRVGAFTGEPAIPNLKFPLPGQDLGVNPIDHQACSQARSCVSFDDGSPEYIASANTTIVWTLRRGIAVVRKSEGQPPLEQGVFLFKPDPRFLLAAARIQGLSQPGSRVCLVRRVVRIENLTQNEEIASTSKRIGDKIDRLKDQVGITSDGLVG